MPELRNPLVRSAPASAPARGRRPRRRGQVSHGLGISRWRELACIGSSRPAQQAFLLDKLDTWWNVGSRLRISEVLVTRAKTLRQLARALPFQRYVSRILRLGTNASLSP